MATKKKKKRKRYKVKVGRIIFLLLFLAVICLGVRLFLDAKGMYEEAKTAKHELEEIMPLIKSENYEAAQEKTEDIHQIIKDIRENLAKTPWKYCDKLPKYGPDFVTGCRLLEIADQMMDKYLDGGFSLLKEIPLSSLKVDDTFNVVGAMKYLDFAEAALPDMEAIVNEVAEMQLSLDTNGLLQKYSAKAQQLFDLYHQAEVYIPFLKAFFGQGGDRLYILAAQNSAEIRAGGGFPGSMGTIRIKDGFLSIGEFRSVWDVLLEVLPYEWMITDQERYLFWAWLEYPRDASYDPYFPKVAQIWAESYEARMGEHIDGVVSMTPIIIQKILACTGPITLEDGTVLDGTNATKFIQSDIYMKYLNSEAIMWGYEEGNAISDALFSNVATSAMASVFTGINLDTIPKFINMVKEGIDERIIMVWMENADAEQTVKNIGAAGTFNTDPSKPQLGVYFSNSNPSKMGWYLDLDISVSDPVVLDNGSFRYTVSVSMTNTIDWYTAYYAGQYIAGETELGYLISYLHLVAPAGGYISGYWMDNGYWMDEDEYMGSQIVFAHYFYIGPQENVTAHFYVTTAPGAQSPMTVVHTPTLQEYR